jgi:predicted nucleic acid-binding protein
MHGQRVVLDTNVFVAAGFRPGSASGRILDAVRSGALTLGRSDATRAETERIVRRIPPLGLNVILAIFRPADRFTDALRPDDFVSVPDPEDRKFAALAFAAGAVLIPNDEHLLGAEGEFHAVVPAAFLRRIASAADPGAP